MATYQWQRGTNPNFTDITGATATSYTVATADLGKQLRVRETVSGVSAFSSPTAVVTAASAYPASYFTGPLGANNILPAAQPGALLILCQDITGQTDAGWKTFVAQREVDCGRTFDGLGIHYGGGGTFDGHPTCAFITPANAKEQWCIDRGSVPVVSWSPNATIAQVNGGTWDGCFTSVATYLAGVSGLVMLRLWWEFDGNWMVWKATVGQEADFVTAWRRVVGLFQAAGATNVGFFWCPTEGFNRTLATACYPGDAYVDWVGSDIYNQAEPTVQTSPLHAGWAEFWELVNYTGHGTSLVCKHDEFGPSKPYVVGETGSLYDSGTSTRKANWYRNIQANANGKPDMPYLCGVEMFDEDLTDDVNEKFDWRVDHNQTYAQRQAQIHGSFDATTYQGFKDWAAQPVWNVGVL